MTTRRETLLREHLAECREAFIILGRSPTPSKGAKKLLRRRGTPAEPFKGPAAAQLARRMADSILRALIDDDIASVTTADEPEA
jgi:hypothetical protein